MMLSVMIPCYNFENYIEKCVSSVLAQQTDFEFEVIVGDDQSTDGTVTVLQSIKGIRWYSNETNIGIAKNTRKLLGECRGKYVSYIDGDDFLTDTTKLQRQVDFLESNTDYVMHSTGCFYSDAEGKPSGAIITPLVDEPTAEQLMHTNYVGFGRTFRNMPGMSPEWMDGIKFHDWAMNFEISLRGKIRCETQVTGGYRILGTGIITSLSEEQVTDHNHQCHTKLLERYGNRHRPKAVVTGGCGFIGSHLVDRLVADGYDVTVIDDLSSSDATFHYNYNARYVHADISKSLPTNEFERTDVVFHLAAESRIQPAILNPQRAYTVNVVGTANVVNACVDKKVGRVVYSSTSSIYGLCKKLPSTEDQTPDCLNPYSHSKLLGEQILTHANKTHGMDCVTLRYFNVFGERSPIKGTYAPVVGIFLNDFRNGKSLNIMGTGEKRRDFVHVLDVVEANILAARSQTHFKSDVINVGTGRNHSIKEIADAISTRQNFTKERSGEAEITLADTQKADKMLGFISSIDVKEWIKTQIQ